MKDVAGSYRPAELEDEVRRFWDDEQIYAGVRDLHAGDPPFFFVDGPPYTTGHIHLGTAWNKIIKDAVLRHVRMRGRHVIDRAGYDMHGLPIEVQVEKKLGFVSKKEIEAFGIGSFIEECRRFAVANRELMSEQFRELGVWLDFDNPYQTVTPEYIEAAWWALKRADEKGMLDLGHRVVNWCPRCETAIADAEVEYWDERDPSIFVKFPIKDAPGEFLVIWTTTPWTLPANVAVAVHPEIVYARVRAVRNGTEEVLWIAEDLVESVLKRGRYQDFTVLDRHPGSELVGTYYRSPLEDLIETQRTMPHRVVEADFVTLENTGLVHIAPGHGWDDYLVGVREGLPFLCPVDEGGVFTEEAGEFAGRPIREANGDVLEALGDRLLARAEVVHRYGHCWRCKTPIIFRATSQWFLRIPDVKERMLEEIAKVDWYPDWAGSARFHDWVRDARDWCISRQRYWGIPIPVWRCPSCSARRVVGTIAELESLSGQSVPDPHRPFVDDVTIPCSCGGTMRRVGDIFDVWFDSAVASWATLGFPGRTGDFEKLWPADFITEGQDQTRGWFYSQLGAATFAFGRAPYRAVLMHGFALDAEGRKMSKSLGNVVAPSEVVQKAGVDVLRLYVLSANAPWDDLKFNWEGVKTVSRTVNILWNVYRFPLPYMLLDRFVPEADEDGTYGEAYVHRRFNEMPVEDRFIISRVNTLTSQCTSDLAEYQLHRVVRELLSFVLEDLSRWYIQLVRPRMWLEGEDTGKQDAYETLYYVLRRLFCLCAPFAPHLAEACFRNLRLEADPVSVHMLSWPEGDADLVDPALERATHLIRTFDDAVQNARQAGRRKLRWPVSQVVVVTDDDEVEAAITSQNPVCCSRANAREVRVVRGAWDRIGWRAEPVMKALGPRFGRDAPAVKALVEAADGTALRAAVERDGRVILDGHELAAEHLVFHESLPDDVFAAPMENATVYVDIALDDDLEGEGYAREVIRRVQEMRRQLDLAVEDHIEADVIVQDPRVAGLVQEGWQDRIGEEVRAVRLSIADQGEVAASDNELTLVADWDLDGLAVTIRVARAAPV